MEDRLLAHLQLVIGAKLRRSEPFQFTWKDGQSNGTGRTTVWVHPGIALVFKYYGSKEPAINPAWVKAMMQTANSATGLTVIPEPGDHAPVPGTKPADGRRRSGKAGH